MDNAEKSIEQVNADQIYTSKQFKRIKDNFQVTQESFPVFRLATEKTVLNLKLFKCYFSGHIPAIPEDCPHAQPSNSI